MVDVDTFLTTLYVMVDDFCKTSWPAEPHPGPLATLSRSEVVTLAMFGQWQAFGSERGFYRYAQRHLRAAFPQLPTREQFNRQMRHHQEALVAFFRHLVGFAFGLQNFGQAFAGGVVVEVAHDDDLGVRVCV